MRILAIDTSTRAMGLALYQFDEKDPKGPLKGRFEGIEIDKEGANPSDEFFFHLEKLGRKADLNLRQEGMIDAYAVALGPGSFTGLRIGVTTAKTLAQFTDRPLVGISTLEAMAWGWGREELAHVPLIDARANRIYGAVYALPKEGLDQSSDRSKGKEKTELISLVPEDLYYEEDFLPQLEKAVKKAGLKGILYIGQGLFAHPVLEETSLLFEIAQGDNALSPVRGVAILATQKIIQGKTDSFLDLAPRYFRKSQAEMDRERCGKS